MSVKIASCYSKRMILNNCCQIFAVYVPFEIVLISYLLTVLCAFVNIFFVTVGCYICIFLLMCSGHMYVLHQALTPILFQIEWFEIFQLVIRFIAVYNRCSLLAYFVPCLTNVSY